MCAEGREREHTREENIESFDESPLRTGREGGDEVARRGGGARQPTHA